jgi:hypothetical protein
MYLFAITFVLLTAAPSRAHIGKFGVARTSGPFGAATHPPRNPGVNS